VTRRALLNFVAAVVLLSLSLSVSSQNSSKQIASKRIVTQPFTLTISAVAPAVEISPDKYTVSSASQLFIKVRVTNTSEHDIRTDVDGDSMTNVSFNNYYDVRESTGNPVPKRRLNHPEIGSTGHGWPPRVIKPGTSTDVGDDRVTGLYDLSQPGEYTIQVSRAIHDNVKDGWVKSNVIRVVVAE